VIRLRQRLPTEAVVDLNQKFADVVQMGEIVQGTALRQEKNEPEIWGLPRLILTADRHNFGRLRELIDAINSAPAE
jgi:hypothetical protein